MIWDSMPKVRTFSIYFDYSLYEKAILGIFVYLQIHNDKSKFSFLQNSAVKAQHLLFANKPFLRKMLVSFFSSNIPLYIEKNPVEKLYKVLWMELKTYTPIGTKFVFGKIKIIIFNMISFANAQGSVKLRLACSKVLLLINYFGRRFLNYFKNTFWWLYKRRQFISFSSFMMKYE